MELPALLVRIGVTPGGRVIVAYWPIAAGRFRDAQTRYLTDRQQEENALNGVGRRVTPESRGMSEFIYRNKGAVLTFGDSPFVSAASSHQVASAMLVTWLSR